MKAVLEVAAAAIAGLVVATGVGLAAVEFLKPDPVDVSPVQNPTILPVYQPNEQAPCKTVLLVAPTVTR